MIETERQLKEWILLHKIPHAIAVNPEAMKYWERAVARPCLEMVWVYYVMAGMNAHIKEDFCWQAIAADAKMRASH
jgi:hypothetical protein